MKMVRARTLKRVTETDAYGRMPRRKRRARQRALQVAQRGLPRATMPPRRAQEQRQDRRQDGRRERFEEQRGQRLAPPRRPQEMGPMQRRPQREIPQQYEDMREEVFDDEGEGMQLDEGDMMGRWERPAPRQFGPLMPMGANLRIQTSQGTRAGMIELRPGLFLVAEIPVQAARSEFGLAVLAPLVTSVALKALENPQTQQQLASAAERGVAMVQQQFMRPQRPPRSPVPWANEEDISNVIDAEAYPSRWRLP